MLSGIFVCQVASLIELIGLIKSVALDPSGTQEETEDTTNSQTALYSLKIMTRLLANADAKPFVEVGSKNSWLSPMPAPSLSLYACSYGFSANHKLMLQYLVITLSMRFLNYSIFKKLSLVFCEGVSQGDIKKFEPSFS